MAVTRVISAERVTQEGFVMNVPQATEATLLNRVDHVPEKKTIGFLWS